MSVALIVKDANSQSSLVLVATEATYRTVWQDGAKALGLDWVAALQAGVVVTEENRGIILEQLQSLRGWFEANGYAPLLERVELVTKALKAVRFDQGETAWIG